MQPQSSRHHYIPIFIIKGFTNPEGKVYVYNKEKDLIERRLKAPKSIFYEFDRNSMIGPDGQPTSFIENDFYSRDDNFIAPFFKKKKEFDFNKHSFDKYSKQLLHQFLIHLYWRVPSSDELSRELIKKANANLKHTPKHFEDFESFGKALLTTLPLKTINLFKHFPESAFIKNAHFYDSQTPQLVLGDLPILNNPFPTSMQDLVCGEFAFAMSSTRFFVYSSQQSNTINADHCYYFNACVIQQSKKYVVAADKKILELSIKIWKELHQRNGMYALRNEIFRKT